MNRTYFHKNNLLTLTLVKNMSTSGKPDRTHYQNLEIKPEATQKEIKTAYFKLSMKYHPDKNQSDEAKNKFQKISQAYEVLNDHAKRRMYDRGLKLNTEEVVYDGTKREEEPIDFTKEAERVQREILRREAQRKTFDFDLWTQKHYGQIFERQQKEKMKENVFKYIKSLEKENTVKPRAEFSTILFLFMIITAFTIIQMKVINDAKKPDNIKKKVLNEDHQ